MSDYQFDNFNDDNNDSNNDNGNGNNGNNNYNKDNNGNNSNSSSNPGSADKVKSRKTIVSIILVLAIIVGVILGINYFKAAGDGTLGQKVTKLRLYSDEYCEEGEGWIHADEMAKVLEPEVEIEYYKDWFTEASGLSNDEFMDGGTDPYGREQRTKIPSVMTVPLDDFISANQNYDYRYYKSIKFKFKYDQQLKITGIRAGIALDWSASVQNREYYLLGTIKTLNYEKTYKHISTFTPSENNTFGTTVLTTKISYQETSLPDLIYKPNMDDENKYFILGNCSCSNLNIVGSENFGELGNHYRFDYTSYSNISFKIDSSVF